MLKHLISLVLLFSIFSFKMSYAEDNNTVLPQPKPKEIQSLTKEKSDILLPQNKPLFLNKFSKKNIILPKNKPSEKKPLSNIEFDKKEFFKVKKKEDEKELKNVVKTDIAFLLPEKKPITYQRKTQKIAEKSKVLSQRDYLIAKEVFNLINQKKWKAALKTSKRVKDKEFKKLVQWMHLKEKEM